RTDALPSLALRLRAPARQETRSERPAAALSLPGRERPDDVPEEPHPELVALDRHALIVPVEEVRELEVARHADRLEAVAARTEAREVRGVGEPDVEPRHGLALRVVLRGAVDDQVPER